MKQNFKQLIIPIIAGVLISGGFVFATLLAPWQGGTGQDASDFTGYGYWTSGVYSTTTSPGAGTVTSVDMSVPTGLSISGNPITATGTLDIALQSGYNIPSDASTTDWQTSFTWGDWSGEGFIDNTVTTLSSLTSIGTIATGTWEGTAINNTYIASSTEF